MKQPKIHSHALAYVTASRLLSKSARGPRRVPFGSRRRRRSLWPGPVTRFHSRRRGKKRLRQCFDAKIVHETVVMLLYRHDHCFCDYTFLRHAFSRLQYRQNGVGCGAWSGPPRPYWRPGRWMPVGLPTPEASISGTWIPLACARTISRKCNCIYAPFLARVIVFMHHF